MGMCTPPAKLSQSRPAANSKPNSDPRGCVAVRANKFTCLRAHEHCAIRSPNGQGEHLSDLTLPNLTVKVVLSPSISTSDTCAHQQMKGVDQQACGCMRGPACMAECAHVYAHGVSILTQACWTQLLLPGSTLPPLFSSAAASAPPLHRPHGSVLQSPRGRCSTRPLAARTHSTVEYGLLPIILPTRRW